MKNVKINIEMTTMNQNNKEVRPSMRSMTTRRCSKGAESAPPIRGGHLSAWALALVLLAAIFLTAGQAWAINMPITNQGFNSSGGGWTLAAGTAGSTIYNTTLDQAADGTHSVHSYITGRNVAGFGTAKQTLGTQINAGAYVTSAKIYIAHSSYLAEGANDRVTIKLCNTAETSCTAILTGTDVGVSGFTLQQNVAGVTVTHVVNKIVVEIYVSTGNTNGATATTTVDSIEIQYTDYVCPATSPTDVQLVSRSSSNITLKWTHSDADNDKYMVYRSGTGLLTTITVPGTYQYSDNTVAQKTAYTYIVNGVDTAYGDCVTGESNSLVAQTRSASKFTIDFCGYCHAMPPDDSFTAVRNTPEGAVVGRHANPYHVTVATRAECAKCHAIPSTDTTYDHSDRKVNMNTTNIGGSTGSFYDKNRDGNYVAGTDDGFATINTQTLASNGSCEGTYCHGTRSASPVWGTNSGSAQCNICHGMASPAVTAWDTEGQTTSTDEQVGAHTAHLTSATNISDNIACNECHLVPIMHTDAGHNDTAEPAEIYYTYGTLADAQNATPYYTAGTNTCDNTYCHDGTKMTKMWSTTSQRTIPVWNNDALLPTSFTATSQCANKCHGYPPASPHDQGTDCSGCHPHVNANNYSFNNASKHIDGDNDFVAGCTGCHNGIPGTTYVSRNIMGSDFTATSRHVFGGTPKSWDCIICHREGDASQAASGNEMTDATLHNNSTGYVVDLRNVDSVNAGWTWNKNGQTNAMHTDMDSFCLNCHDSGGATAIAVTGVGAAEKITLTPTTTEAQKPFNGTDDLDEGGLTAGSSGIFGNRTRVIDVKTQFATTNPSHHAVLGQRYTSKNTTWNGSTGVAWVSKTLKSGNNLRTDGETSLLHCSDCHTVDQNGHSGTNQFMMTGANITATCQTCHSSATYSGTPTNETVSRWSHDTNDGSRTMDPAAGSLYGNEYCMNCHGGIVYGGIHGMSGQYTAGSARTSYRFIPGAYMMLDPGSWTTAVVTTCYFRDGTLTNCGTHANGSKSSFTPNYGRATTY